MPLLTNIMYDKTFTLIYIYFFFFFFFFFFNFNVHIYVTLLFLVIVRDGRHNFVSINVLPTVITKFKFQKFTRDRNLFISVERLNQ